MQLTAYLSTLTKSTNILNDVRTSSLFAQASLKLMTFQIVDKHTVLAAASRGEGPRGGGRRGLPPGRGGMISEWERFGH